MSKFGTVLGLVIMSPAILLFGFLTILFGAMTLISAADLSIGGFLVFGIMTVITAAAAYSFLVKACASPTA